MIHVYCGRPSNGARSLVTALRELGYEARRLRNTRHLRLPATSDLVVCWGQQWPLPLAGHYPVVLNYLGPIGKLNELRRYHQELVVPTIRWTDTLGGHPGPGWYARRANHQGGSDLADSLTTGDYYVFREEFAHEFRIHIFGDLSIRAGLKVPGENAHSWIKTHQQGWRIDYGPSCRPLLQDSTRQVAKAAVRALRYDFGAVDVGVRHDGSSVVFETNSAPGLETPNTALAYARHIGVFMEEQT